MFRCRFAAAAWRGVTGKGCGRRMFPCRDFIFSLKMHGDIALSGSTKGLLLAHDVAKDKVLWGLGANQ